MKLADLLLNSDEVKYLRMMFFACAYFSLKKKKEKETISPKGQNLQQESGDLCELILLSLYIESPCKKWQLQISYLLLEFRIIRIFFSVCFLNSSSLTFLLSYSLATCIYLEYHSECNLLVLRTHSLCVLVLLRYCRCDTLFVPLKNTLLISGLKLISRKMGYIKSLFLFFIASTILADQPC